MKRLNFAIAALVALVVFRPASAQDDERYPDDAPPPELVVVVERAVNLHPGPSTARNPLQTLSPGRTLTLVSPADWDGFYHVLTESGAQAWVWAKNVRVEVAPEIAPEFANDRREGLEKNKPATPKSVETLTAPASAATNVAAATAAPAPCRPFDQCTDDGCYWMKPEEKHALVNRIKRRPPQTRSARLLAFADFTVLQRLADRTYGKQHVELDLAQRQRLRRMPVSSGNVDEGDLVIVTGFVVGDSRANTGETVNCLHTTSDLNDYHISIAPLFEGEPKNVENEFRGIVVEMIPQDPRRLSRAWDISKVREARDKKRRVLVAGALFYDNIHVVRPSKDLPGLSNQPRRFSLWELHPVTGFYVCMRADGNCDPRRLAQWAPLERLRPGSL